MASNDIAVGEESSQLGKNLRYWVDERGGRIFCLIEATNKEAAMAVHEEAHGHVADEIVEVRDGK